MVFTCSRGIHKLTQTLGLLIYQPEPILAYPPIDLSRMDISGTFGDRRDYLTPNLTPNPIWLIPDQVDSIYPELGSFPVCITGAGYI